MTTVPGFIYLNRTKKPATNVDNDMLSNLRCEKDDDIAEISNWEIQPGVWWKDENNWLPYDKKVAEKIMKADEIGVRKIRFNKSATIYSQCVSVQGPVRVHFSIVHEFPCPKIPVPSDSASNSSSTGAPEYEVDLMEMKEVHMESGIRKDIKIVKVSMTGCLFSTFSTYNDSSEDFSIEVKKSSRIVCQNIEGEKYRVRWKDDIQGWCVYNDSCQRAIWSAWTKGDDLVSIKPGRSAKDSDSTDYIIDLKRMQQINVTNGQRKPIQIAMWISSSLFPHMWFGDHCKYLTQEIGGVSLAENEIMLYKLALSRVLCPEYIKDAISEHMKPHTLKSLELNTHLDLANNGHWYRFLHSFVQTVKEIPDSLGHLWRFALNPSGHHRPDNPFTSRNSNGLWRFVFGAPSDERSGAHSFIKPGTKISASTDDMHLDWFGLSSTITEFHCKPISDGVVSMLVFLVMMPKNHHESLERAVFVKKVKDYLPVASITVCIDDSSLGPVLPLWEDRNDDSSLGPACSLWEEVNEKNCSMIVKVHKSCSPGVVEN